MPQQIRLIATCPDEAKHLLVGELTEMGAEDIFVDFRAVHFTVSDKPLYYEAHLRLRTASGLYRVIKVVRAPTEEILYNQSCRIDWPELFTVNKTFRVDGIDADRSGEGIAATVISKKIRQGIVHRFKKNDKRSPPVNLKHPQVLITGFNQQYKCTIGVDTVGRRLHRRGYRTKKKHPAPLKETLAAAILLQIGYRGQKPLIDVMCGSGTLAIEAAMIASRRAPSLNRPNGSFAFENLRDFDRDEWCKVKDDVQADKRDQLEQTIIASDIEEGYVQLAKESATKAQVDQHIEFSCRPFSEVKPHGPAGIVIANLPYGDRMITGQPLVDLYKQMGDWLKNNFSGWEAVLITATASPYRHIGLQPRKKYKFYNGRIEIVALVFELYSGSRKRIIARGH